MKLTTLSLLGAASALMGCTSASSGEPTLCEVAANRSSYAGKTLTVEGSLLVSKHGSAVVDPTCDKGVPVQWFDGDTPPLRELSAVTERALAEPMKITVRVTGEMKPAPRSEFLNEPSWYLSLKSADVLGVKAAPVNE